MFKPAVKHESKLRLAIAGPSGSGKTYTALAIGTALGSKVAVVDTEHGSASKYADLFNFDVVEMHAPFHPNKYVEAIKVATEMGYDVVILDSLSHAWNGQGGLLEIVDDIAKRMKTSNTFAAWKDATPIQNSLVENMVGSGLHLIATMRSKQEYVMEQIERNGRTINQPKKVGMAPIQRDSMEYEFDVYMDMTIENDGIIQKTRCPALTGKVFSKPGADVAGILKDWLSGEPAPAPAPPNPPGTVTPDEFMAEFDRDMGRKHDDMGNSYKPGDSRQETSPQAQAKRERPKAPNGKAADLAPPMPDEKTFKRYMALGGEVYGDEWDDKRPVQVTWITNQRKPAPEKELTSSKELTLPEIKRLIAIMEDRQESERQPIPGVDELGRTY